jgi:hypothetical protein
MQFKSRLATEIVSKTRTKSIPDIQDAGLDPGAFVTAEQLSDEFKIPREAVLQILDKAMVWPTAKLLNRKASGQPAGGRPKMAFDATAARLAIEAGVDQLYG